MCWQNINLLLGIGPSCERTPGLKYGVYETVATEVSNVCEQNLRIDQGILLQESRRIGPFERTRRTVDGQTRIEHSYM